MRSSSRTRAGRRSRRRGFHPSPEHRKGSPSASAATRRNGAASSPGPASARSERVSTRAEIARALRMLAPRIPTHEFEAVLDHARASPGLKTAAPETAAWLSLVAYARHVFTDYDELLQEQYDSE